MATLKLLLTVPEAASSSGTITFKVVVETQDTTSLPSPYTSPVFRTFQQIAWLRTRLIQLFPDLLVSALPDPPVEKLINDQDYVEQKRLQMERFLAKIGTRSEFVEAQDMKWFLGSDMTFEDAVDEKRGPVKEFIDKFIKQSYDKGFRVYRPGEIVQDNDQAEFQRRQSYVLLLESRFSAIFDTLNGLIQARNALNDGLSTLGDLAIDSLNSKHILGSGQDHHRIGPENEEKHRILDKEMQVFGALMDELGFVGQRQGKAETFFFGDIFLEYKATLDAVKVVMNNRTEKLVEYVNVIKQHNKKRAQAEKARLRMQQTNQTADVEVATKEEQRAAQEVEVFHNVYAGAQTTLTQELVRFEKQKARDLRSALRDYVHVQLKYERLKLETAEKAIEKIRTADFDVKTGISNSTSVNIGISRDLPQTETVDEEDDDVEGYVGAWIREGIENLENRGLYANVVDNDNIWQSEQDRVDNRFIGDGTGEGGHESDFLSDSRDPLRGNDPLRVGGWL